MFVDDPTARVVAVVAIREKEKDAVAEARLTPSTPAESVSLRSMQLAHELRRRGFTVTYEYTGHVSAQMKKASKREAAVCLFVGEEEVLSGKVGIKSQGNQRTLPFQWRDANDRELLSDASLQGLIEELCRVLK